jgi:hypothetical protein
MKKHLKAAKDLSIGDTIRITGYTWEVDEFFVTPDWVEVFLWCWASPRKRISMRFMDKNFPVTVR